MKLSREEVAVIEDLRKNKKKSKQIFIEDVDRDGCRMFAYVATDVLPKFEIPKSWLVKKEDFDPYCDQIREDDPFFDTKYYIVADWGYYPGDDSVSKNNKAGDNLYFWLLKNQKKPFLKGVWINDK